MCPHCRKTQVSYDRLKKKTLSRFFKVSPLRWLSGPFWGQVTSNWWLKRPLWRTRVAPWFFHKNIARFLRVQCPWSHCTRRFQVRSHRATPAKNLWGDGNTPKTWEITSIVMLVYRRCRWWWRQHINMVIYLQTCDLTWLHVIYRESTNTNADHFRRDFNV